MWAHIYSVSLRNFLRAKLAALYFHIKYISCNELTQNKDTLEIDFGNKTNYFEVENQEIFT